MRCVNGHEYPLEPVTWSLDVRRRGSYHCLDFPCKCNRRPTMTLWRVSSVKEAKREGLLPCRRCFGLVAGP